MRSATTEDGQSEQVALDSIDALISELRNRTIANFALLGGDKAAWCEVGK